MSTNAPAQPKAKSHFQTLDKLRCDLDGLKVKGYTYGEIGLIRGISGGLAWSIINEGYDPKSPQIRKRLNLPPLKAEAPVCSNPTCDGYGQPHTYDCQTEQVKPKPERPKRKRKREYPAYFKGSQTDIEQVKKQVAKYHPDYELKRKGE